MARPKKKGLEYFPMDVTMFNDVKIRRLLRKSGTDAIAVYIQLLTEIYKQGYWLATDEDTAFIVGEQVGMEENSVKNIMEVCVEVGLFNADIYVQDKVLTSRGIQERYQAICKQCGRACDIAEYTLISSEETIVFSEETPINSEETPINSEETPINSEETPINSEETPVSCPKSTQSKVKKTKEKEKEKPPLPSARAREPSADSKERDWCDTLKNNTQFVETLAINKGVTCDTVVVLIEEFHAECAAKGIVHNGYGDYRRHCYDWARIHIDKQKERNNGKKDDRQGREDRRGETDFASTSAKDYKTTF